MEEYIKNLEEKVNNLEEKVSHLEKIERKRKIKIIISITIKIIILLILVLFIYQKYNYINNTYIKPYKEKIDNIEEKYGDIKDIDINNILDKLF